MLILSEEEHKKVETYFTRDNQMYTDFEKACKDFYQKRKHEKYTNRLMIRECELRAYEDFDLMIKKIFNGLAPYEYENDDPTKKPIRRSLTRLGSIYENDRSQYYLSIGEHYTVNNFDYTYAEDPTFTEGEIENMRNQHFEFLEKQEDIGIKHLSNIPMLFDRDGRLIGQSDKVALVELDFALPEKLLIERIHEIKKDFKENPDRIQSLEEFLKIKPKDEISLKSKIGSYRQRSLARKYTDMLFIYDCHRMGLTPKYSLDQINEWNKKHPENRYTRKSKNPNQKIKLNEMDKKTYSEYLNLMFELIANHKK